MTVTLERPGVDLKQEFQVSSPTILKPLLASCIVGPARQIVEGVTDAGILNAEAQVTLPAMLAAGWVSDPFTYTGIGGDSLNLRVNRGPVTEVEFAATPNQSVTQVAGRINARRIPGLIAEVETSGEQQRLVLRTTGRGSNMIIQLVSGDALTPLGFIAGEFATGSSGYAAVKDSVIQAASYPDPRNNLAALDIDYDSVRVFLSTGGGGFREASKTSTVLFTNPTGGTPVASAVDDGDLDGTTPYVSIPGQTCVLAPATLVGTVDLTTLTYGVAGDFDPDVTISVNIGGTITSRVLTGAIANAPALLVALNTFLGVAGDASMSADNFLVLETAADGPAAYIHVGGSAADILLGVGSPRLAGGSPGPAVFVSSIDRDAVNLATLEGKTLTFYIDGADKKELVFPLLGSAAAIIPALNALVGAAGTFSLSVDDRILFVSASEFGGWDSRVTGGAAASENTAITVLGFPAALNTGLSIRGGAHAPIPGDEFWANGAFVGFIVDVQPAATVDDLPVIRLDREVAVTRTYSIWHIVAKDLDSPTATLERPAPELAVDASSGTVTVKSSIFHSVSTGGNPTRGVSLLYLAYNALRLDVSSAAERADLVRYGSTTSLEAALSPLDPQNPLGLGMYMAMLAAPGIEIAGIGIDEATASAPEGTTDAYVRAFELLEAKEVYAIAPLTHSNDVGQLGAAHVTVMSESNSERCIILNPLRPTRATDTLIASSPLGNAPVFTSEPLFDSGVSNLETLLLAAGVQATMEPADNVFVEFEGDTRKFLIESVSGGNVTLHLGGFTEEENPDGFYFDAETVLSNFWTSAIVDRPFSVKIRGGELATRTDEAIAYADIGRSYKNRRVIATAPDKAVVTLDSLDTIVEGYYIACGLAGRFAGAGPSQPMTEEVLPGFKAVIGSSDYFGEPHLKILSGGGLWVFQSDKGENIYTRHQLTTDMSTKKTREASILRAVDASAMYMRVALRNYIGRFNITQTLIDALSTVAEGIVRYLIDQKVVKSIDIVTMRQSADEPDEVEIEADIEPFYPCNKIRVRFRI